jgi:copper homeostasis protein CutC
MDVGGVRIGGTFDFVHPDILQVEPLKSRGIARIATNRQDSCEQRNMQTYHALVLRISKSFNILVTMFGLHFLLWRNGFQPKQVL